MRMNNYTFLYFGFGLAVVVLAVLGFITYRD